MSAIFAIPVIGAQATPVEAPTDGSGSVTNTDRPCYLIRPGWNTPAGWEQPVCTTEIRGRAVDPAPGTQRVQPDYLP